jgi:hypothetical protein
VNALKERCAVLVDSFNSKKEYPQRDAIAATGTNVSSLRLYL